MKRTLVWIIVGVVGLGLLFILPSLFMGSLWGPPAGFAQGYGPGGLVGGYGGGVMGGAACLLLSGLRPRRHDGGLWRWDDGWLWRRHDGRLRRLWLQPVWLDRDARRLADSARHTRIARSGWCLAGSKSRHARRLDVQRPGGPKPDVPQLRQGRGGRLESLSALRHNAI